MGLNLVRKKGTVFNVYTAPHAYPYKKFNSKRSDHSIDYQHHLLYDDIK